MVVVTLMLFLCPLLRGQSVPIGIWQEHFPWRKALFTGNYGDHVFCVTGSGLFSVSVPGNEISRLHKMNGLSATGIVAAGMEESSGKIVLVYADGGIDIVVENEVFYIPDLKLATGYTNKSVYHVSCSNNKAYLSTGFGILVLNLSGFETEDTWLPAPGGVQSRINQFLPTPSYFYAATQNGGLRAPSSTTNPADFAAWEKIPGLPDQPFQALGIWNNVLYACSGNTVYRENNGTFSVFYQNTQNISSIKIAGNRMAVIENTRISLLEENGSVQEIFTYPNAAPTDIIRADNAWWIADKENGLQRRTGASVESFTPNGPYDIVEGSMAHNGQHLSASFGKVLPDGNGAGKQTGFGVYTNGIWTNYVPGQGNMPSSFPDVNTTAFHPANGYIYAGSSGGGLLELHPDGNTNLIPGTPPNANAPLQQRVHGLSFDRNGLLWLAADGASNPIAVLLKNNTIFSFPIPFTIPGNRVSQIVEDDAGQLWIISPNGNGLLCLNHNNTPDVPGDDRWRLFRAGQGNGNLPDNNVHTIAKDRNGFIWIGTNRGIGVMQCASLAISTNCEVVLPIVQQDNFAGYLFQNEQVKSIAVDGANRKWVGTNNGVWLIDAAGEKIISRFTEDNSPLPSNSILSITINGKDGTVFIATANGLCSFRGTATEAGTEGYTAKIFPNPVSPGYTGTIAIKELPRDAIVKITEPNGRLVFQTKALGGQAVWNGRDYRGNRVASGVYLVLATDEERKEHLAGKIVIVR
ncbi:MAG: two-component regulator propeller domain-containing protein [Chitinophagaceae bacterium]